MGDDNLLTKARIDDGGYLLALGKNFKGDFFSNLYAFLHFYRIPEIFEIEVEIFDPLFLEKNLKNDYSTFMHLIGKQMNFF